MGGRCRLWQRRNRNEIKERILFSGTPPTNSIKAKNRRINVEILTRSLERKLHEAEQIKKRIPLSRNPLFWNNRDVELLAAVDRAESHHVSVDVVAAGHADSLCRVLVSGRLLAGQDRIELVMILAGGAISLTRSVGVAA